MARQQRRSRSGAPAGRHAYPRTARLSETLREIIAEELVRIDDERIELVTVTRVETDPEMNRALVYYDSLAGETGDAEILEVLAGHRKRLQSAIASQIRAKKTPILSFAPDDVIRAAERIDDILRESGTLPERVEDDLSGRYKVPGDGEQD